MSGSAVRPMRPEDWTVETIEVGRYSNAEPLAGFQRCDGRGGNALHPIHGEEHFEATLSQTYAVVRAAYPGVGLERHTFRMPYWTGPRLPGPDDYVPLHAPQPLTTTSVTVITVPRGQVAGASMGFYFQGRHLSSLRDRMRERSFQGIAGNLGYYMTADLIQGKPWAHNARYPDHPLPQIPAYLGFHLARDASSGEIHASFEGAHPATLGIRTDGSVEILPRLDIAEYHVRLGGHTIAVTAVNDPDAVDRDVVAFTPALRSADVQRHIAAAEATAGAAGGWETFAPTVPLPDADRRVNVFVANEGDGQMPVAKVIAIWVGSSPLPSFGGVLSFRRAAFESLFGSLEAAQERLVGNPVQIVPAGRTPLGDYAQMLGGFVPVVVDGQHVYCVQDVEQVMENLSLYGNANSPIGQTGRETRNFDLYVREPAGALFQTDGQIGWILFDGRHELSIGAGVVDVAQIVLKLQHMRVVAEIQQAFLIDGGSAMKAYHICSDETTVQLEPLNRVAAGSRNGPGADEQGLNLYSLLSLRLA